VTSATFLSVAFSRGTRSDGNDETTSSPSRTTTQSTSVSASRFASAKAYVRFATSFPTHLSCGATSVSPSPAAAVTSTIVSACDVFERGFPSG